MIFRNTIQAKTLFCVCIVILVKLQQVFCDRHYALDSKLYAEKYNQLNQLEDDMDQVHAFTVTTLEKKRFRQIFPINIRNTQVVRCKKLGDGSFGIVYLGRVTKNNKRVAVKVSCKIDYAKAEYNTLRILKSRYFPRVYFFGIMQFGAGSMVNFFAMELLKGSDMYQLMKHYDSAMSGEYLRYVVAQLLVAIEVLHDKGYMHRDIKPENVMCESNGTIKVIDFGGCLPAKNDSVTYDEWFGTREYMAPELYRCFDKKDKDCKYTRLADWWSAGSTIYYAAMFTDIKREKPIETDNANLTNLIRILCSNDPKKRKLNFRKHPYFNGFNWKSTK